MSVTDLSSKRIRHADIDGLRGLAILVVVVFHVYQYCHDARGQMYDGTLLGRVLTSFDGVIGWFFVVSAFLLYVPLARQALSGRNAMAPGAFLIRRLLRVVPLFWFAAIVVWTYRTATLPGDWRDLAEHLTFTQVFDEKRIFYTIGPAWFLAVEVMFYFFVAAMMASVLQLCRRLPTREHRLLVVSSPALLLVVGSWSFKLWEIFVGHVPADHWVTWFGPMAWADNLGVGMLVAVAWVAAGEHRILSPRVLVGTRAGALAVLATAVALRGQSAGSVALFHELCMVSFVALLASSVFAPSDALWRRALAQPFLAWVGTISFSIFVWHEPILLFLSGHALVNATQDSFWLITVVLLALSIPIGWVSYWAIEYPVGHLRHLFAPGGGLRDYYGAELDKPRPHLVEPADADSRSSQMTKTG